MKYVTDFWFEKEILALLCQFVPKEEAIKIDFKLFDGVVFIAQLWMKPGAYMLLINIKAKELIKSTEGRDIFIAALTHELGHVKDVQEVGLDFEEGIEFLLKKEQTADRIALSFLRKKYSNPKEILLKQVAFAVNATKNCGFATQENIDLAELIANARTQAILID